MNGDNKADIVGFSQTGVSVSLSNGGSIVNGQSIGSFQTAVQWSSDFGISAGWTSQSVYPRIIVDLNGDNRPDVIGFGTSGVGSALNRTPSNVNSFTTSQSAYGGDFCTSVGYDNNTHYPRQLGKINSDNFPDIFAITQYGFKVALGKGDGTFYCAQDFPVGQFSPSWGWTGDDVFPRGLYNVSSIDGSSEIVGFASNQVVVTNCSNYFKSENNLWGESIQENENRNEEFSPTKNSDLLIYPNPNNGEFVIDAIDNVGAQVKIYNTLGELLRTENIVEETHRISLQGQPKGLYFLEIKNEKHNVTFLNKVLVE